MGSAMLVKGIVSVLLQILQFILFLLELRFIWHVDISFPLSVLDSQPEEWLPHPGLGK